MQEGELPPRLLQHDENSVHEVKYLFEELWKQKCAPGNEKGHTWPERKNPTVAKENRW